MTTAHTFREAIAYWRAARNAILWIVASVAARLRVDAVPVDEGSLEYIAEYAHALTPQEQQFIAKLEDQRQRPLSTKQGARLDQIIAVCRRAERER